MSIVSEVRKVFVHKKTSLSPEAAAALTAAKAAQHKARRIKPPTAREMVLDGIATEDPYKFNLFYDDANLPLNLKRAATATMLDRMAKDNHVSPERRKVMEAEATRLRLNASKNLPADADYPPQPYVMRKPRFGSRGERSKTAKK